MLTKEKDATMRGSDTQALFDVLGQGCARGDIPPVQRLYSTGATSQNGWWAGKLPGTRGTILVVSCTWLMSLHQRMQKGCSCLGPYLAPYVIRG